MKKVITAKRVKNLLGQIDFLCELGVDLTEVVDDKYKCVPTMHQFDNGILTILWEARRDFRAISAYNLKKEDDVLIIEKRLKEVYEELRKGCEKIKDKDYLEETYGGLKKYGINLF